jgi:hypothetical protein
MGTYKYVGFNKWERGLLYIFRGVNSYFVGSELTINRDFSFDYNTCGNVMNGKWFLRNDSIFLNVTSDRWRIDSLNVQGYKGTWPKIPTKPIGFKIINDYLENVHHLKNGKKVIEKLKLID